MELENKRNIKIPDPLPSPGQPFLKNLFFSRPESLKKDGQRISRFDEKDERRIIRIRKAGQVEALSSDPDDLIERSGERIVFFLSKSGGIRSHDP
jgi:hypothetical protein